MQLHSNAMSPYGRKVTIVINALGLEDRVELVPAYPRENREKVIPVNPIGKIPVLVTDDGLALRDSRVIAEFLASEFNGSKLLPASGAERWRILTDVADADGIIEAAVLTKNERARPEAQRSGAFIEEHLAKIERGLQAIDARAESLKNRRDLGAIAIGCALAYVPLRVPEFAGLSRFPGAADLHRGLMDWPAFAATEPAAS